MNFFDNYIFTGKFLASIIVVFFSVLIWYILRYFYKSFAKKNEDNKSANFKFLLNIIKYILMIIDVVCILQIYGVNVASLVAGLGILGIIVGFALQDALKDFMMGISIVWDKFYKVGDFVKYKNIEGKIVDFNIKITKIYDINTNNIFTLCNRNISEIEKLSDWLFLSIPCGYDVKLSEVKKVFNEICNRANEIEDIKSCDFLGTDNFGDSAIFYKIKITAEPDKKMIVRRKVLEVVQVVYEKYGIEIPYSQIVVHNNK
ncbi:MAG: mechanosensitive ion channel family protein [Lachnospirales bacterium]